MGSAGQWRGSCECNLQTLQESEELTGVEILNSKVRLTETSVGQKREAQLLYYPEIISIEKNSENT